MDKIKRPAYEFAIVAIVVALAILLSVGLFSGRSRIRKSNMLIQELAMMRSSIILYKLINSENPPSLEEMASSTYEVDGTRRPYIDRLPQSKGGEVVDPFGNPYAYDPKSGWVQSSTPDFARW